MSLSTYLSPFQLHQRRNGLVNGIHILNIQAQLLQLEENLGHLGNTQAHLPQLRAVGEHLPGGAGKGNLRLFGNYPYLCGP